MRAYGEVFTKTVSWTAFRGNPLRLGYNAPPSARSLQRSFRELSDYLRALPIPPTAFNCCWTAADIRVREDVIATPRRFGRGAAKAGLGDCGDA